MLLLERSNVDSEAIFRVQDLVKNQYDTYAEYVRTYLPLLVTGILFSDINIAYLIYLHVSVQEHLM